MSRAPAAGLLERWKRSRLHRVVRAVVVERLTSRGRGILAVVLASALLGQNLGVPIHRLFAFSVAALLAAGAAARLTRPRLLATRREIPASSAGETVTYEVEIENLSRRPARDVHVLELGLPEGLRPEGEPPFVAEIPPGERAVVTVRLRCRRRGAHVLRRLAVGTSFPLGLARSLQFSPQESSFLVYPAFTTPETFPVPAGRNYQPGGFLLSSNVGESAELMHLREWRDGDNPRHVHWPSSARLGELVVKVFHEEYFVRLALVVDTELRDARGRDAFERGLSHAAGVADWLSRREYIIDVFAAGEAVHRFQAGRALAHLDHVLELLACLDPAERVDWDALESALVPEAPQLTGLIAIFTDWSEPRARVVERLESLGVAVRVLVVRDDAPSVPLPPHVDGVVLARGDDAPGAWPDLAGAAAP